MTALQPAKSPISAADVRHERVETPPVRQAIRSDLAPSKVVTAAASTDQSRAFGRELLLDPQSRDVLMRVIDERSRPAARRQPEKALARLRAYLRADRLDERRDPPHSVLSI